MIPASDSAASSTTVPRSSDCRLCPSRTKARLAMNSRFPFNLIPDSTGDKALAACSRLKLDILAMPSIDDDPPEVRCDFELHGSFDLLEGNSGALLRALISTFKA